MPYHHTWLVADRLVLIDHLKRGRVIFGAGPGDIEGYGTERLRAEFLVERLFETGRIAFAYTLVDRMIVGGACPAGEPLPKTLLPLTR